MLKVRDVMTADVVTVSPETTLREAMELLAARHVSGAPVVSAGQVVGVVTADDLMSFASAMPGVPAERPPAVGWDEVEAPTLEEEVEEEDEPASAYFSALWDDAGAEATTRLEAVEGPEWNALEDHDVSEVMTRSPLVTISPDASVESAAALMERHHIHRVLATEGKQLAGIVTAMDVAKAAAEHRFTARTYAFNRDDQYRDRDKEP